MKKHHGVPSQESAGGHWHELAACTTADPDLFFPDESGHRARRQVETAKRICAACPVRARCLSESLDNREAYGVWGGLDEDERRQLLAARRTQAIA